MNSKDSKAKNSAKKTKSAESVASSGGKVDSKADSAVSDGAKSEMLVLAEAMNNLAGALRDSNQLARDMQLIKGRPNEMGLIEALNELAQRLAILATRIR